MIGVSSSGISGVSGFSAFTLTIQLYLSMQKAKYDQAFGIAVVLLLIVLAINGLAKYLSHKFNTEVRE